MALVGIDLGTTNSLIAVFGEAPDYLAGAVQALDGLIRLIVGPVTGQLRASQTQECRKAAVAQG
jgi:molecular chaperone DnaK (HSP70)